MQNKQQEITFFDHHAEIEQYDVFTADTNQRVVDACVRLGGFKAGMCILDLGCGSGIFTNLLQERGLQCLGLDISHKIMAIGRATHPGLQFVAGDVERLPFRTGSVDGILLSGVIHHLPDPSACAREVYRVLRPGGTFVAFDPNRLNPVMWLYRDRSSPLYSSQGVTENERPIIASQVARIFSAVGFRLSTDYLAGMHYRYVASSRVRWLLPLYNLVDDLFRFRLLRNYRPFVLTSGIKS